MNRCREGPEAASFWTSPPVCSLLSSVTQFGIPTAFRFYVNYDYGLHVDLDKILAGEVDGEIKIDFSIFLGSNLAKADRQISMASLSTLIWSAAVQASAWPSPALESAIPQASVAR